jgi:hypothetical protein
LVLYCCVGAVGFSLAGRFLLDDARPWRSLRQLRIGLWAIGGLLVLVAATKEVWWGPVRALILTWARTSATDYVHSLDHFAQPGLLVLSGLAGGFALVLGRSRRGFLVAIGTLCLLSQAGLAYFASLKCARQIENINVMHLATGEWLNQNVPQDVLLALDDIGGITYVSRRRMVDMIGLVTPEALRFRRAGKTTVDFLSATHPNFVATIRPAKFDARPDLFQRVHIATFSGHVASVSDTLVVFETIWNRPPA